MNYTAKGWKNIQNNVASVAAKYNKEETRSILLKDDYYKSLFGRAKNRTLMKHNPELYNSIYKHTQPLEILMIERNKYFGHYSFSNRIKFITECNYDIEELRCECGKEYTWSTYCRSCPEPRKTFLGKYHTEKTKKKMRKSTIEYINTASGQCIPRYNINSISIIDEYGKQHGYNFQHAENGGEFYIKELGYWVDGYDKDKNTVIEIDEPHHFNADGSLKEKDIIRQKQITELLNCKFVRIKIVKNRNNEI